MAKQHSHFNKELCIPNNNLPKVVIIGAGFAGINLVKNLRKKQVQIILLDQHNYHQFQPLLYQVAISGLEPDSIVSPIRKLFKKRSNLLFRMAEVVNVNPKEKYIQTNIGYINYDYLVIATGSRTNYYNSKNIEQYSIGLKNINDAINIRSWMLQNLELAVEGCSIEERDTLTNFVIVGGGPAGVEMAGALAEFKNYLLANDYPEIDSHLMKLYLIQSGDRILPTMSEKASKKALEVLNELGIDVLLNTRVLDYNGTDVIFSSKDKKDHLKAMNLIWTAGVKGNIIQGIHSDAVIGNRYKVDQHCQIINHQDIFAIGDIAAMISDKNPKGHPMVAQAAIQQGKWLATNLIEKINSGKFSNTFEYKDKGSMATIGKKNAVADLKITFLNGKLGWLIWSFIHLISITGFKNKISIAFNWITKYFSYEKANQLIIRKYQRKK